MTFAAFLLAAWTAFLVVGLVPRTTRTLVDALALAGWRAAHVWSLGLATSAVGILAAARGTPDDLWLAAVVVAAVPLLPLSATLAHRTGVSRVLGPHGSRVPPPVESVWRDVDGTGEVTPDGASYWSAAAQLRTGVGVDNLNGESGGGSRRGALRSYRPLAGGRDLTSGEAARDQAWLCVLRGLGWAAGVLFLGHVIARPLSVALGRAEPLWLTGVAFLAVSLWALAWSASWLGRRLRGRLSAGRARRLHGIEVTWWMLAAAHGWRVTRPGVLPFPHWRTHPVFASVSGPPGAAPALTLSGRVSGWDVWIVSGRAGRPRSGLVAALALPGVRLPALRLERLPGADHDRVRTAADPSADLRAVLFTDAVLAHLGATLPAYAELLLVDDLLALALRPRVESEPWRADAMLACLLGLADLLPDEVLAQWLLDPDSGAPDGFSPSDVAVPDLSRPADVEARNGPDAPAADR